MTRKATAEVTLNEAGEFVYDPKVDLVKVAVVERHQGTGNVARFLKGYGLKQGRLHCLLRMIHTQYHCCRCQ